MSFDFSRAVWDSSNGMKAPAKLLLLALADMANESGLCWPSTETLCHKTGLSESAVRRNLAILAKGKWITRTRRRRRDGSLSTYEFVLKKDLLAGAKPTRPVGAKPALEPTITEPTKIPSPSLRSLEGDEPKKVVTRTRAAKPKIADDGALKPTALGVEAAQAFVEWHRSERGTDPVTAFQGIRSVATAVAKRGYAFDEIVAGLKKTRVMTAKAVQDEIEHARRSPGSAPHSPGAASEPVLGPPIPGEVLRAFQRASPWLDEFRGWKLDRAMAMDVVTYFVTKRKMSPSEAMIRLAIAVRDQKGDTVEREGLVHWMFKAPVKPPKAEIEDLPAEMERGFINRVWRGA